MESSVRQEQFEALLREHQDAVYRQMVRACGNFTDAEDALAEAMLRAYQSMDSLRDQDHFRGWLTTIAKRICGRMRTHTQLAPLLEMAAIEVIPSAEVSIEEQVVLAETKSCVMQALDTLSPEYRSVYWLRDVEGLSGEEVADQLGLSLSAMKSRLHRARAMVREAFQNTICS